MRVVRLFKTYLCKQTVKDPSMHWHLDVTFKEDANKTIDKRAAENLNIIRKWCISILKMIEIFRPKLSMKKKRFVISMNPAEFLEQVLAF